MSGVLVLTGAIVLTMSPDRPRAEAVAVDTDRGTILAVGTADECRRAAESARPVRAGESAPAPVEERDLGGVVLAPGFIEPHSHPFLSGVATQPPAHWIAPYVGYPTWDDVAALFTRLQAQEPAGAPLLFNGLDRLLQEVGDLDRTVLDGFFPDRPVGILDNSGHEAYVNSAAIDLIGWPDRQAPPDPVGGSFGRGADGTSTGRASELPAVMTVLQPLMAATITHPLYSAAQWYATMARAGITSTSEMTYSTAYLKGYEALASVPDCPLRISLYHMSTEPDADKPLSTPIPDTMLRKQGIKLWADGSPWVGTAALSYPYLDTPRVRDAGIALGPAGESAMNYTRAQLDALLDRFAPRAGRCPSTSTATAVWTSCSTPTSGRCASTAWPAAITAGGSSTAAGPGPSSSRGWPRWACTPRSARSSSSTGVTCSTAPCSPRRSGRSGCASATPSDRGRACRSTTTVRSARRCRC